MSSWLQYLQITYKHKYTAYNKGSSSARILYSNKTYDVREANYAHYLREHNAPYSWLQDLEHEIYGSP
jgi:hypothetical protein